MKQTFHKNKTAFITVMGLVIMSILTLTKIVPSTTIAGYSVFVGIAFFFILEAMEKPKAEESGLRFKTIPNDIKKTGVLLFLLPMASAIATLLVGNLIFGRTFVDHVLARTGGILSFNQIPLLIGQVLLAAFGEEIAFRGFFVGKAMKHFPFWVCVIVSSVCFAAGHIAVGAVGLVAYDVATVFIDSILYSMIYRKSGNCVISTLSHILCNAVGIAATFIFF